MLKKELTKDAVMEANPAWDIGFKNEYEQNLLYSKSIRFSCNYRRGSLLLINCYYFRLGGGLKHDDGIFTVIGGKRSKHQRLDTNPKTSYTSQIKTFDISEVLKGRSGLVFELNITDAFNILQESKEWVFTDISKA